MKAPGESWGKRATGEADLQQDGTRKADEEAEFKRRQLDVGEVMVVATARMADFGQEGGQRGGARTGAQFWPAGWGRRCAGVRAGPVGKMEETEKWGA